MGIAEPSLGSLALSVCFKGRELATATAFVAISQGRHYLVTNWHVVAGRDSKTGEILSKTGGIPDGLAVLHHVAGKLGHWERRIHPLYDESDNPLWLEHPVHGRSVDVVALPIATQPQGTRFFHYDLDRGWPLISFAPSNTVSIIGFPFAISGGGGLGVWVQGTIATEPDVDYWDLPLMLVDSRTRPGQSGSPVMLYRTDGYITEDGSTINNHAPAMRPIGIYSGRINEESDLGLVWKLDALREILAGQKRGPLTGLSKP